VKEELEFDNQRKDEEIVIVSRRHPWVLAKTGLIMVGLLAILFLAFLIFGASLISSIALLAILVIMIVYGFIRWFVFANDIFILTNQRVININQGGFFTRRVTEAELANILNVSYEIKGPIKSFLNFGDIMVDTSGSDNNLLVLRNIENPHFVQERIVSLQKKAQGSGGSPFASKPIIR